METEDSEHSWASEVTKMKELSFIIVNYNVKEFLVNLISSINKSRVGIDSEIIVVDNCSDDGSQELIAFRYPDVIFIENGENLGFGRANNIGMERASGRYLVLINPDVLVREDTFRLMLRFFEEHQDCGLAGCKVLNPDGSLQLACRRGFPGPWTSFTKITGLSRLFPKSRLFARYNMTYLDENETCQVDAISGAFMMLKREVFSEVGGFDERFFMYGEDLDLCYRIKSAGYNVYYFHGTEIIHYKGESTKRSGIDETKEFYQAMHLFVGKHFSSFLPLEWALQFAVFLRKMFAFLHVFQMALLGLFLDFFLVGLFTAASEYIYLLSYGRHGGFPLWSKPWVYIVPGLIQISVSLIFRVYGKKKLPVLRSSISAIAGFFVLSSITYFFKEFAFSRGVLLICYTTLFFAFPVWRILYRIFCGIGLEGQPRRARTIIVGTGPKAEELAQRLSYGSGLLLMGFVGLTGQDIGARIAGLNVLGSIMNLKKVIEKHKIQNLIFPKDDLSYSEIFELVSDLQGMGVDFMLAGGSQEFLVGKSSVSALSNLPLYSINYNISFPSHRISKLLVDKCLSFLISVLVKPFSGFIKSSKLKEFINSVPLVLKGSCSLVGPRTLKDSKTSLYIGRRGLTGLWYTEDSLQDEEEERLNIFYAKNQTLWLDFNILLSSLQKMTKSSLNNVERLS